MPARVVEVELDQTLDRELGVEVRKIERTLAAAQPLVDPLQGREVEALLVAEVVIDHALVGAGSARDRVDAAAEQALGGEFVLRRHEDGFARAIRVTLVDALVLDHAGEVANAAD